jgi:hypothetical protein
MQQPSQLLLPQLKMEANEGKCKVLDKMCPRPSCSKPLLRKSNYPKSQVTVGGTMMIRC